MIQIFTLVFLWTCTAYNDRQFIAKMIRALYFQEVPTQNADELRIVPLKFKLKDKFFDFFNRILFCRSKEKSENQKIF